VTAGVSPHLSPFTCSQCYLVCRVVPLECSSMTATHHLLMTSRLLNGSKTPASWNSLPDQQLRKCRRQIHCRPLPKKQPSASSYPTNTNSSIVLMQLDNLWQARAPLAAIPLRSTNTDQPSRHPKENKMASRRQWLALSLTFCRSNETGKPETSDWLLGMRKVSHGRKETETMCFECHASIPSASSGSLLPASQKHHTRFARRKSATDHLYSTSEEALHKLTAKPALENPPLLN